MKKIISIILVIIWCLIIFLFSNQNGNSSTNTSDIINKTVIEVFKVDEKYANDTSFIVRKCAHFLLYFILGLLVYNMFNNINIQNKLLYTILFCIIYSITDEIHQYFIPGRTFKLFDILLDSISSFISSYIWSRHEKNK